MRVPPVSGWTPKVFWSEVCVVSAPGGFDVALDGRRVRTPGKAPLTLPTRACADLVAAEWRAQTGKVDAGSMPFTRTANSAIDKVAFQAVEVAGLLSDYGGTDLMCHRAPGPAALVERQDAAWDPLLDWAATVWAPRLVVTTGVMPVAQPGAALAGLRAEVAALDPFRLAAFHDLVSLSGSLVLGLAVRRGQLAPEAGWSTSRIDEDFQTEAWGDDAEAAAKAALKKAAFLDAAAFLVSLDG